MTDKELKKLKRSDLLEMLITQSKEVDSLKKQLQEAQEKLEKRDIAISSAGSIAEAALGVNQIFELAQKTADQYLENVQRVYSSNSSVLSAVESVANEQLVAMQAEEAPVKEAAVEPVTFVPPAQNLFVPPVQPASHNPLWQQPVVTQPNYVQPTAPVTQNPVAASNVTPTQPAPTQPAAPVKKKSVVKPVRKSKR